MRYRLRNGVEHPFSAKISENLKYILPLLLLLITAVVIGIAGGDKNQPGRKPLTLGIYTVKTGDSSSGNQDKDNGGPSNPTPSLSTDNQSFAGGSAGQNVTTAAISQPETTSYSAGSVPSTGGMGGGTGGSAGTATPIGSIVCTGTSALLPTTCAVCTNPISLTLGQKAILNSDGSCSVVDP